MVPKVRTVPLRTELVILGRKLKHLARVLFIRELMTLCILAPFSPAPARFLNLGLGIPIEITVASFLWTPLLVRPDLVLPCPPCP